eukprot:1687150-Prorocentrum_lima.AAC.1
MTSSLVGSEMCIRDSVSPVHPAHETALRLSFLLSSLRALSAELSLLPVSYTHLTLPTICSV